MNQTKKSILPKLAIFGVFFLIVISTIGYATVQGLDKAVAVDEEGQESWAQVENQLQRRHDLIPNLVSSIKGTMKHEKEIFTEITKLRSQWSQGGSTKDKLNNAKSMNALISNLLVSVENYPELKANQNVLALQDQLEGTENRISVERMRYNRSVQDFNEYKRQVIGSIFMGMRGLNEKQQYFEVAEKAKEVPKVTF